MEARDGEDGRSLHQRLVGIVSVARTVKEFTEAVDNKGKPKPIWVAISEPSEVRRKAKFAAKVKRLLLEAAETLSKQVQVQVEYRAGTVWAAGKRVASATAPKAAQAEIGDFGWIDIGQIAATLGTHQSEVKARWEELEQQLS